jgi:hypothetical protein
VGHGAKQSCACLAGQLVGRRELACPDRRDRDKAARRWLLVQHLGPAIVQFAYGKLPSGKPGFPP